MARCIKRPVDFTDDADCLALKKASYALAGGFDVYSRTTARHMGKHIAGSPSVQVENMLGAGSMIAANHLYNQAKPDGLTIGNWIGGLILKQTLGVKGIAFEAAKFEWIGAPVPINNACLLTRKSGITSLQQWMESRTLVKIGAEAADSGGFIAEQRKKER